MIDQAKHNEKLLAAISKLYLSVWFEKLEISNTTFNKLFLMRAEELAGKPDLNLKELKKESVVHYRELTDHLKAFALIEKKEIYETIFKTLDSITDTYNGLRRKRKHSDTEEL